MVKKYKRKNNLIFNNTNMNNKRKELILNAKNRIEIIINISWKIISGKELIDIKNSIETENINDTISKIRLYLEQYWNIIIKSDIGKALYELIDIFREIDEEYKKEDEE